jgi:hypothetical protein
MDRRYQIAIKHPICNICKKEVKTVEIQENPNDVFLLDGLAVTFYCHGDNESHTITMDQFKKGETILSAF